MVQTLLQLGPIQTKGRLHVYTPPDWFDAGVDGVLAWSTIKDNIFYFSMDEKRSEIMDELPENIDSWSRWNIGADRQLRYIPTDLLQHNLSLLQVQLYPKNP